MSENSNISWCTHTFNPWIGCFKKSPGCARCYAATFVEGRMGRKGLWGPPGTTTRHRTAVQNWNKLRKWNRAAASNGVVDYVFTASLADIFEDHPLLPPWRADLFAAAREYPYLTFLMLTKRPENIPGMLPGDWGHRGYPNVWLGTSVEDARVVDRIDALRHIPAPVRFISYEPAIGPLNFVDFSGIDWLIYGGESGPGYRPDDPNWARSAFDLCDRHGTRKFYKQGSASRPQADDTLDGKVIHEFPLPRSLYWDDVPSALRAAQQRRYMAQTAKALVAA